MNVLERYIAKKKLANALTSKGRNQPVLGQEKTAASITSLQKAYRALNPTRVKSKPTQLFPEQMKAIMGKRPWPIPPSMNPSKEAVTGLTRPGPNPFRNPASGQSMGREEMLKMYPKTVQGRLYGQIRMPKGAGGPYGVLKRMNSLKVPTAQKPYAGVLPGNMSGEGKKAFNLFAGLHEGFERAVPGKLARQYGGSGSSHVSPRVLMNEHNMIVRATGPGAEEARSAVRAVRNRKPPNRGYWKSPGLSDAEVLQKDIRKYIPDFTFGQGDRLPKSLVKKISRNWANAGQRGGLSPAEFKRVRRAQMAGTGPGYRPYNYIRLWDESGRGLKQLLKRRLGRLPAWSAGEAAPKLQELINQAGKAAPVTRWQQKGLSAGAKMREAGYGLGGRPGTLGSK